MCQSLLSYHRYSMVKATVTAPAIHALVSTGSPKPLSLSTRMNMLLTLSMNTAGMKDISYVHDLDALPSVGWRR